MRSNYQVTPLILRCLTTLFLVVPVSSYAQEAQNGPEILKKVADIPMPGPAVRFDYQSLDTKSGRLYISHMNADQMVVFDTATRQVVANLEGFKRSIPLGGGAGNTVYDSGSGHILVAVHSVNELVAIDPASAKIVGRYSLPGIKNPHGIALDTSDHLAFVAGEENHSLGVIDLNTMKVLSTHEVGEDPDVLAYDPGLKRLYVSAESGTVSVFEEGSRDLRPVAHFFMPHAHTVSVDPKTHFVYFPLENVDGHPLLRIMRPTSLP
jgi:DNA-binding beta-propeller fold protein YncE